MENVTITLSGEGLQDTEALDIQVSIAATVNIGAKAARGQVTAWLVSEVGNMLVGGEPQLIIGNRSIWRVPATLTSSEMGTVGQVGAVDVDAKSGELLISNDLREQILDNVKHLTRTTPFPVG